MPSDEGLIHRHAWVWDALPADCHAALAEGDPTLRRYLDDSGLREPRGAATPDALVAELPRDADTRHLAGALERFPQIDFVAVAVGGGEPGAPAPVSVPVRALQLLLSPLESASAARVARRVERLLRSHGYLTRRSATGDRSRKHGLGPGGWRARRRVPIGWVVSAGRERRRSVVEAAIEAAATAGELTLTRASATVYESGKLMIDLVGADGRRYIMRLAAGPAREALVHSLDAIDAVAAAMPAPDVLERLALPVARGPIGPAEFSLEPTIAGSPPPSVSRRAADDALAFLVALRKAPTAATDGLAKPDVAAQAERLAPFVDASERPGLERVARELEQRVGPLAGGLAHGDFWRENLIVRDDRLTGVIDWEWAVSEALPMLDLFDFLTLGDRQVSHATPGVRLTRHLWRLREQGHPLIERYCAATGVPNDARTLEGLMAAYWLDRTSRELLPWWDRLQRDGWLERNVREPLAMLVAAGW